ncbi:MAG: FecR domain-containing protein [Bacteroidetes bacterium]|nr:FecR domain-containing protein [Bacteroidota bacterium]
MMKIKSEDNFWKLATGKIHNELTPDEASDFDLLLQDDDNKKRFQDIVKTNEKIQNIEFLQQVSIENSQQKISGFFHQKKIRLFVNLSKYAAIIVLTFAIGSLLNVGDYFKKENPQFAEINVPLGQMSEMTLYDGTKVWLNSGTTLRYESNFGKDSRNISLQGEAFFKVKPGEIPFKIKLKNSEVEVLGTSFNVVSYNDDDFSCVTLVEGKVKINSASGTEITQLKPTEQITVPDNLKNIKIKNVDTNFYSSWINGKIIFEEQRLADIVEKLKRWYNVDIRFSDKEIGDYRFSGTILKSKPFNQITTAFELLLPVKIKYTQNLDKKDSILISKK